MIVRIILFLIINFIALAIGGFFTGDGAASAWYQELNKAPWTPPGWVFGAAWSFIMICFAFYMAMALGKLNSKKSLLIIFSIQWILDVGWNPVFFYLHEIEFGLLIILGLTFLIGYILVHYKSKLGYISFLILPYFVWLIIASSLNAYIFFMNP
ncbi:MAG: tryptophan-rich sensory protein [Cyclobacteriaceae bacterium]